jgi:hypothetical protein
MSVQWKLLIERQTPCPLARGLYCGSVRKFENGLPGRHIFSSKLCAAENVTLHIQFGMTFLHSCHGVPLLCRTSASDELQIQNLSMVVEVPSVRAAWRQVIDLSGHSSGELLQVM